MDFTIVKDVSPLEVIKSIQHYVRNGEDLMVMTKSAPAGMTISYETHKGIIDEFLAAMEYKHTK